jgi:hypothetical protein
LIRKTIDLALGGDPRALRLCIDRLIAPRRGRALPVPAITRAAEVAGILAAITAALADGVITAGEAAELGKLAETFIRVIETTKSSRRFELL